MPNALGEHPDASTGGNTIDAPTGSDANAAIDAPRDASIDAGPDRGVEQDDDDLALALADIARSIEMTAMIDAVHIGYAVPLDGFTTVTAGELAGTRDGATFDYIYHCEDQQAQDNLTCGPLSNHAHVAATINAPMMVDTFNMTELKLSSHWTVREIYLNTPRVQETGRLLVSGTVTSDATRFQLTLDGTWTDVLFDPDPTLPSAGTIAYTLTGHRHRAAATPPDVDLTGDLVVTFLPGGQATVAIDATHVYAADLTTGSIAKI